MDDFKCGKATESEVEVEFSVKCVWVRWIQISEALSKSKVGLSFQSVNMR